MAYTKSQLEALDGEFYKTLINEGLTPLLSITQVIQARVESGDYNSRVFRENNNAYGMLYVRGNRFGATQGLRKNDTKNKGYYANFPTYLDSAKAAAAWVLNPARWPFIKDVKTLADYAHALKTKMPHPYYEATEAAYTAALIYNYKKVSHLNTNGYALTMPKSKLSTTPTSKHEDVFI